MYRVRDSAIQRKKRDTVSLLRFITARRPRKERRERSFNEHSYNVGVLFYVSLPSRMGLIRLYSNSILRMISVFIKGGDRPL
jgi:hypothetical protein